MHSATCRVGGTVGETPSLSVYWECFRWSAPVGWLFANHCNCVSTNYCVDWIGTNTMWYLQPCCYHQYPVPVPDVHTGHLLNFSTFFDVQILQILIFDRFLFVIATIMCLNSVCCHAMLCISEVYAWSGVCLSRLCILLKRTNISSEKFSLPGSHIILVFWYQMLWQYCDENPLTGAKITIFDNYLALTCWTLSIGLAAAFVDHGWWMMHYHASVKLVYDRKLQHYTKDNRI